jgi:hypothetical protein
MTARTLDWNSIEFFSSLDALGVFPRVLPMIQSFSKNDGVHSGMLGHSFEIEVELPLDHIYFNGRVVDKASGSDSVGNIPGDQHETSSSTVFFLLHPAC